MLAGPQQKEFRKEILQTMQVGVGRRNKFCENIISVPLPLAFTKFKCAIRIYV
ncbi:nitrogen fixation protein NifR [Staphylococcus aureus]|nr:nitrogen fixation protein NifR [Staphylococcus aureus]AUU55185.1 nitrogen fixation protein NifR [Staphylococcus aureus]AUU70092.1 nitrogen fixation protein NifR [Staphylococcus aureus]AUU77943.1 nitrogen fixation protein NifR [Staphylococcus aureus]AVC42071.1 nitrogen fixation protein NifR [Staphylococcus aureus]